MTPSAIRTTSPAYRKSFAQRFAWLATFSFSRWQHARNQNTRV